MWLPALDVCPGLPAGLPLGRFANLVLPHSCCTQVEAHACGFRPDNALALVERYDVVVDASDNPATRYLVR